jgi:hypothetical protein
MERVGQERITKKLALVLIACLSVTICFVGPVACSRQCTATSEDYAVYSAILLNVEKVARSYDKAELIIFEETSSREDYSPPIWDLRPPIKQASDETVVHFMSREKCRWHLKPRFDAAISYRIVSTEDLGRVSQGKSKIVRHLAPFAGRVQHERD